MTRRPRHASLTFPRPMYRYFVTSVAVCLLAALAGCNDPGPEFAPVTGVVTRNGKPQQGLLVRFLPDPEQGNAVAATASGETDAEGRYQLTYNFESEEGAGAPVGWNRVLIEDTTLSGIPQGERMPPRRVPPSYQSPATTPLRFEVTSGAQEIDIELPR